MSKKQVVNGSEFVELILAILANLPGYDSSKEQVLGTKDGVFTWIDK